VILNNILEPFWTSCYKTWKRVFQLQLNGSIEL